MLVKRSTLIWGTVIALLLVPMVGIMLAIFVDKGWIFSVVMGLPWLISLLDLPDNIKETKSKKRVRISF